MNKTTRKRQPGKPEKPRRDFALFAHSNGQWAKKIRGKLHYFGSWAEPRDALQRYLDTKDALHAGRTPKADREGLTVRDLCNHFLTSKEHEVEGGEIRPRTCQDYHDTCSRLCNTFGKDKLVDDLAADDFTRLRASMAKQWGPVRLGNEVQRVRTVFKYGYDAALIDKPVRYGPSFKRPRQAIIRRQRYANGEKMFEPDELKAILREACPQLTAMILLGLNGGLSNEDCGRLPMRALDLRRGWLIFPRTKTAVYRRIPLWPETVDAIKAAIAVRPMPKDELHKDKTFITKYGNAWANGTPSSPISQRFGKIVRDLGVHRRGLGFYTLRHVFETIGGECRDQVAVNAIMGHVDNTMATRYRERISDERLRAVVDHVRAWLGIADWNDESDG